MALARGAQHVRPPDGHHPRVVLGRVGVLAGEAQAPLAQLLDDVRGGVDAGPLGLIDQVERVAVEARVRRQPAQPRAERVDVGDVATAQEPSPER